LPLVLARLGIKVVETGITVERLGICVRHGNATLRNAVNEAQAALAADGTAGGADQTVARDRGDFAGVNVKQLRLVRRNHRIVGILASPSSR
jgi:hypothetical protein